jgi:hypothetical protein
MDTSAVLAYVQGVVGVGELIAEVADNGDLVAVSAVGMARLYSLVGDDVWGDAQLRRLEADPTVAVVALGRPQARPVGRIGLGDSVDLAHAVLLAIEHGAYYATTEADRAAKVLPPGWDIFDMRR